MTDTEIKKTATDIVKHIKAELKKGKDAQKNNPYYYVDKNVHFGNSSTYDRKLGKYVDYIVVNGKEFKGVKNLDEIQQVSNEVIRQLTALKETRGYKNLILTKRDIYDTINLYYQKHYVLLDDVALPDNACKEFISLRNYLNKYGNANMRDFEFYSAHMGGKRGVLWGEEGDRFYLDNKPNKCGRILGELRKIRGSKDIITCKRGEEDYMDEMERRYSAYHEVECDGEKRKYLEVVIKSPTGKVKYTQRIY